MICAVWHRSAQAGFSLPRPLEKLAQIVKGFRWGLDNAGSARYTC